MGDSVVWLQQHLHEHSLLYFIALYTVGGRPVAILTASLFRLNLLLFFPLVVFMDTVQVPCFYYLYEHTFTSARLQRLSGYFALLSPCYFYGHLAGSLLLLPVRTHLYQ